MPDGTYSYGVSARVGSWTGAESSRISVTIDTSAPTIVTKPSDPSAYAGPTFAFSHADYSIFVCQLDGYGEFTAPHCSPGPLDDDSHTLAVEAQAADGSLTTAAVYTWRVHTGPPTIATKPSDPSADTAPTFAFSLVGYSSFVCQLDTSGTFTADQCSPSSLAEGSHTLDVEAQAVDGSLTTAASYTWTIGTVAPVTTTTSDSTTDTSTTGTTGTSGPTVPQPDPAPPDPTESLPDPTVSTDTTTDPTGTTDTTSTSTDTTSTDTTGTSPGG